MAPEVLRCADAAVQRSFAQASSSFSGQSSGTNVADLLQSLKAAAPGVPVYFPGETKLQLSGILGTGSFGVVYSGQILDSVTDRPIDSLCITCRGIQGDILEESETVAPLSEADAPEHEFAVKMARMTSHNWNHSNFASRNVAALKTEAVILARAKHRNIVQLLGIGASDASNARSLFLIQEKINGPSLEEVVLAARGPTGKLVSAKAYRDVDAARWALGVAQGLQYLHTELGILHRDVKIGNIRLSSHDMRTSESIILDYGVSCERLGAEALRRPESSLELNVRKSIGSRRSMESRRWTTPGGGPCEPTNPNNTVTGPMTHCAGEGATFRSPVPPRKTASDLSPADGRLHHSAPHAHVKHTAATGTLLYMAPEQRGNSVYDCEAEVYSLGLMMYELFNRTTIQHVAELEGYTGSAAAGALRQGWRPPPMEKYSATISRLVSRCTDIDPCKRPKMPELISTLQEFIGAAGIRNAKDSTRHLSLQDGRSGKARRKLKGILSALKLVRQ